MPKINKIKLSGTSYDIQDSNASKTVTLTQAQYDALQAKDPNTFYIISDGETFDPSEKVDTSAFTAYSASVETALSGKQDTLVSGTNIKTINNESILGSGNIDIQGGGKAVSGGTNISITTGETADTINCTLPITATSNVFSTISVGQGSGGGSYNTLIGANARCDNNYGHNVFLVAQKSSNSGSGAYVNGTNNVIIGSMKDGYLNFNIPSFSTSQSVVIGGGEMSTDKNNSLAIGYNANVSGTTKTNINNQLTIDTSNQVYIYNKDNTEMICLQDQLGGGGGITSGEVQSMIDESISGKTDESAFTAHTADTTIHVTSSDKTTWSGKQDALVSGTNIKTINNESILGSGNITIQGGGGSSVVELTQAQYDALTTIDPDTIYVITDAAGGDLSNYYTKTQINAMIGDIESLLAAI